MLNQTTLANYRLIYSSASGAGSMSSKAARTGASATDVTVNFPEAACWVALTFQCNDNATTIMTTPAVYAVVDSLGVEHVLYHKLGSLGQPATLVCPINPSASVIIRRIAGETTLNHRLYVAAYARDYILPPPRVVKVESARPNAALTVAAQAGIGASSVELLADSGPEWLDWYDLRVTYPGVTNAGQHLRVCAGIQIDVPVGSKYGIATGTHAMGLWGNVFQNSGTTNNAGISAAAQQHSGPACIPPHSRVICHLWLDNAGGAATAVAGTVYNVYFQGWGVYGNE